MVVEPKTKKEIEFKSKIPEYTMWVLPTTLEEEDISNQYQWGSSDMVNIHLTNEEYSVMRQEMLPILYILIKILNSYEKL